MKIFLNRPLMTALVILVLIAGFSKPTQAHAAGVAVVENVDSITADGSYKPGDHIQITVQFDQAVLVDITGGVPYICLETGTVDQCLDYASGSGTDTLLFEDYIVQAGDASADLDYVDNASFAANGGTIKDNDTNTDDADLTLPVPGDTGSLGANAAIVIDTTAPSVSTFTVTSPSSSLNVPITAFTGSDDVSSVKYLITISATQPADNDSGWNSTVPTSKTVAGSGTYTLYPWVMDAAGNVSAAFGSPRSVTVDVTKPTVSTFTVTSPSASLTIPVTAFTGSDNVGVAGYMITTSSTPPSAGAAAWTATAPTTFVVLSDGPYTLYPWTKDAVGNVSNVFGSPRNVTVDSLKILFGAYTTQSLQHATEGVNELVNMNTWLTTNGANGVTFAGDFVGITFNPGWNVPHELDAAWNAGFMPFVNLMPSEPWQGIYYDANCETAADIAAGLCDGKLTIWANYFKTWAGATKQAYIAPLPEMNGNWAPYSSDGATYIQAFTRIRTVFDNAGVPADAVRWVFAPNGWNDPAFSWRQFENYYPGDANVDIVSFSAYNYGGCPAQFAAWDTFDTAMKPYLDRMRVMAPSKPIFISQTGVIDVPVNGLDPNQTKSIWVQDTFSRLADYPAVRAIMYFNKINAAEQVGNCFGPDYRIYNNGGSGVAGFLSIMQDSRFEKLALNSFKWDQITTVYLGPSAVFVDVPVSYWANSYIESLYNAGVTGGCVLNPLSYCPDSTVTRAQMAIFLEKGMRGSSYSPPAAQGNIFGDVSSGYWAVAWIEKLAADSITGGCNNGNYCPDNVVTRAQMAIFLLKAKHGPSYSPPVATGNFIDVPANYWAAAWIEQLALEGITGGCGTDIYCPDSPVTRAQMAIFLVRTFNLP